MITIELVGFSDESAQVIAKMITYLTAEFQQAFKDEVQCILIQSSTVVRLYLADKAKCIIRVYHTDMAPCELVRDLINNSREELEEIGLLPQSIEVQGIVPQYKK